MPTYLVATRPLQTRTYEMQRPPNERAISDACEPLCVNYASITATVSCYVACKTLIYEASVVADPHGPQCVHFVVVVPRVDPGMPGLASCGVIDMGVHDVR